MLLLRIWVYIWDIASTEKYNTLIELDIQYEDKEEEVDTRSWVGAILAAFCLSFTFNCNLSDALCIQKSNALHTALISTPILLASVQ